MSDSSERNQILTNIPTPDLTLDAIFSGHMLPGDKIAVEEAFGRSRDPDAIKSLFLEQSDLIAYMTPRGFVAFLPIMLAICLDCRNDSFDLYMKIQFMFESERTQNIQIWPHFAEIDTLLSPEMKLHVHEFFTRYRADSADLRPEDHVPLRSDKW